MSNEQTLKQNNGQTLRNKKISHRKHAVEKKRKYLMKKLTNSAGEDIVPQINFCIKKLDLKFKILLI